eukprot:6731-Heterococcus_DN1.PRE.1
MPSYKDGLVATPPRARRASHHEQDDPGLTRQRSSQTLLDGSGRRRSNKNFQRRLLIALACIGILQVVLISVYLWMHQSPPTLAFNALTGTYHSSEHIPQALTIDAMLSSQHIVALSAAAHVTVLLLLSIIAQCAQTHR